METEKNSLEDKVQKVLSNRYDHLAEVPPEPEYLISIGGKGIALPGSIIGIYGMSKSRKSSFMAMVAAACLSPTGKFEHITSKIKGEIIWVDTEQSETEVKYFQDKIVSMSKAEDSDYIYDRYFALKLRPYEELERLEILDRIFSDEDLFENAGLIVLDGIADFVYNVNDMEASKKLVTKLTNWADKLQVPIIVALHTNKDGKDATGSLGGFLNKKCSYAIKSEIQYDGGPSLIKPYHTRNGKNFEPFLIHNDKDTGRPVMYIDRGEFHTENNLKFTQIKNNRPSQVQPVQKMKPVILDNETNPF